MRNGVVYYQNDIRRIEMNVDIDPQLFEYDEE